MILTIILSLTFTVCVFGQFDLEKKLKKKANKELNKAADDAIDKSVETIKKGGNSNDPNNKPTNSETKKTDKPVTETNSAIDVQNEEKQKYIKLWSKYDFVAGDKIIFEDNLIGEESGEFPSRWDLRSGGAEIASLGGETVIHFINNNSIIIPLMDKKDFLPEVFTIEFDVFFEKDGATRTDIYKIRFYEGRGNSAKINGKNVYPINIKWNEVKMGEFGGKTESHVKEKKNWQPKWKHIAIAFNKRSLKLYMNEERMLNIPNLGFKPKMLTIGADFDDRFIKMSAIKNIRVNEGGKKLYDRILAEGKFVTRGILFDVNKSTIKGESMGTINEIVQMMKDHPELKFRVEGHTDSDGGEHFNQKLSEERAAAVKSALIEHGINASRLDIKGCGESNPVSDNTTPEGKANNRRVEFIKI
jgi:OOP family OmpA-OmpF porin